MYLPWQIVTSASLKYGLKIASILCKPHLLNSSFQDSEIDDEGWNTISQIWIRRRENTSIHIIQLHIWLIFCFIDSVDKKLKSSNPIWKLMEREVMYFTIIYLAYISFHWQSWWLTNNEQWNMDTNGRDVIYIYIYSYVLG